MANENKKPVWISTEAHEALQRYCEHTQRTQVEVVSELLYRVVRPELEAAGVEVAPPEGDSA